MRTGKGPRIYHPLTAKTAIQQAEAVDAKVKAGEEVGPLAGVPLTVKDIFAVKGDALDCGLPHPGKLYRALYGHRCTAAGSRRRDQFGQGESG